MISIWLGNVGSGKTASAVRELIMNDSGRLTYSNIITKKISNNRLLSRDMIIKKEVVGQKKNGDLIYDRKLNIEFWEDLKKSGEALNVIIDEAHTLVNPRRAMSKQNIIMTDWIALLRRILGSNDAGYGQLIMISQLRRRIDPIAREMSNLFVYHVCHYTKSCLKCGFGWSENNETAEPIFKCPKCNSSKIKKHSHILEVWKFNSEQAYLGWREYSQNTYFAHYYLTDIERVFPHYDTLQWDNLISDYD